MKERANKTQTHRGEAEEITALLRGLPADSPARQAASDLAAKRPLRSIQPLVGALLTLSPKRWRERAYLVRALGQAARSERDRDIASGVLCGVIENNPREKPALRLARGFAIAFLLTLLVSIGMQKFVLPHILPEWEQMRASGFTTDPNVLKIYERPAFKSYMFWLDALSVGILALAPALSLWRNRVCYGHANGARIAAAEQLTALAAPESAPILARALFDRDRRVREAVAAALHETLSLLTPEHANLFDAESLRSLGRALRSPDSALVVKALAAIKKVGTPSLILPVARAAAQGPTEEIRKVALATLRRLCPSERIGALAAEAYCPRTFVRDWLPSVARLTDGRKSRSRERAATVLRAALPAVTAETPTPFSAEAVANLGRLLDHPNEPLVLQVLAALEKIGTGDVLTEVERCAAHGESPEVRAAAERTRHALEARTLAAFSPDSIPSAAHLENETEAALLLHAAQEQG